MGLVSSGRSLLPWQRDGSPEARPPGQPLTASSEPPAHAVTCRDTLQSKATQAERRSPARDAATRIAPQDHPRAPTQPAGSCSGAAPPASTQGHPHFSWVPLPSAVPRGTRSSLPRSRDVPPSSLTSHGLPYKVPAQKIIHPKKRIYPQWEHWKWRWGQAGALTPHPVHRTSWELPKRAAVLAEGAEEWPKA